MGVRQEGSVVGESKEDHPVPDPETLWSEPKIEDHQQGDVGGVLGVVHGIQEEGMKPFSPLYKIVYIAELMLILL